MNVIVVLLPVGRQVTRQSAIKFVQKIIGSHPIMTFFKQKTAIFENSKLNLLDSTRNAFET